MAFVENQGVRIHWDEAGQGVPVLLLMGLSCPAAFWHRTRPALAERYRTIALDNRGAGLSDAPAGPYSIAQMTADAAAVLDAAGVEAAHVYGVSMGSFIAQEMALQYPRRVLSLILGCTSPGGRNAVRAEPEVRDLLLGRNQLSREQSTQAFVPILYHPATPRQRIEEDLVLRRQWFQPGEAYMAQLMALRGWESYDRLPQILAQTLVIHGDSDRLIPPKNGELVAGRIAGAQLAVLPGAGHVFSTDQPEAAQKVVLNFLAAQAVAAVAP